VERHVQRIEGAHEQPQELARDWIDRLHHFSHIDQLTLRAIVMVKDSSLVCSLGPEASELSFRLCTAVAASIIAAHPEALDDFLGPIGARPIGDLRAYGGKVAARQQEQVMRFPSTRLSSAPLWTPARN
jgi:hypothetical protein